MLRVYVLEGKGRGCGVGACDCMDYRSCRTCGFYLSLFCINRESNWGGRFLEESSEVWKMIFSKRGFGAEELLKMLVALVILCLVVLGFYRLMTGHWPVNYIPGFNQTGEGKTELAMVRYVITEDR